MLSFKKYLEESLEKVQESGLYKEERLILSPQSTEINVKNKKVLNFCSNNYLAYPPILK